MKKKNKIIITGAGGLIGSELSVSLKNHGYGVINHYQTESQKPSALNSSAVIVGELSESNTCGRIVADCDVLIHLAQSGSPIANVKSYFEYASENMAPTLQLIDKARETGRNVHFIFASSGGALYKSRESGVYGENDPVEPLTPYGITKFSIEQYLRLCSETSNIKVTVLRISNPYGSLLDPDRMQGLIGVIFSRIQKGLPIRIFGDVNNIRDYIFIDDLVNAFISVVETKSSGKFNLYNIGYGAGYSVGQVLDHIGELLGKPLETQYEKVEGQELLPYRIVLDYQKAHREIGWQPKVGLEEGLRMMAEKTGLI